jgi:hypothetical protein
LWTDSEETGPYGALDAANLDTDPALEIIAASRNSEEGRGSGRLHLLDAKTLVEKRRRDQLTDFGGGQVEDVRAAQLDNDNSLEIIWSGAASGVGALEVIDANTFARQVAIGSFDERYAGFSLSAIGLASSNGGRFLSLGVATQRITSAATPVAMVELDALSGFQTGLIPAGPAQDAPTRIDTIDLDNDGTVEYVLGVYEGVSLRRSLLGPEYASVPSASPRAFAVARFRDGVRSLVTVGPSGALSLRDANDLSVIGSIPLGRPAIPTAIRASDVDPSIIIGCAGDAVFKADLITGGVVWGPRIGVSLCGSGRIPSLGPRDGRDIVVVGSARGVHVVSVAACIFCDGFE